MGEPKFNNIINDLKFTIKLPVRLAINTISNYSTYKSSLVVNKTYLSPGLYPLTFTLASSNNIWQYTANITQCIKFFLIC